MENGSLGEARVRAILLERFWVHTRSVDVDGADFLVELRSNARFTDELSPRLGVVQAKFAQGENTTHYIPAEYAADSGTPLKGFFVMVCVGHEDSAKTYLLTASEICSLPLVSYKGSEHYRLSAKGWKPYRQKKITKALDLIEQALLERTETQNDRFLRSVNIPDFDFLRRSLNTEWCLPIPNEAGFIPDLIYHLRGILRTELYMFDDILNGITRLLTQNDARACLDAVNDVLDDGSIEAGQDGIAFVRSLRSIPDLAQTLHAAIDIHERRIRKLRNKKQLDVFAALAEPLSADHQAFYEKHREPKLVSTGKNGKTVSSQRAQTCVRFVPGTNNVLSVKTKLVSAGTFPIAGPDEIIISRMLWAYAFEEGPTTWREMHRLQFELFGALYQRIFPKEKVGPCKLPYVLAE